MVRGMVVLAIPRDTAPAHATVVPKAHHRPLPWPGIPCAAQLARHATAPTNDGDDDGGGVDSNGGLVMTVAMKLRDNGDDGRA